MPRADRTQGAVPAQGRRRRAGLAIRSWSRSHRADARGSQPRAALRSAAEASLRDVVALGGPERFERRFRAVWIAFCLACGVLAALGGLGYTLVVWIISAMLLFGLGRLIWAVVRWSFRT